MNASGCNPSCCCKMSTIRSTESLYSVKINTFPSGFAAISCFTKVSTIEDLGWSSSVSFNAKRS